MHPQTVPAGNSPEYHSQFRVATELGDVHGSGKLKINQGSARAYEERTSTDLIVNDKESTPATSVLATTSYHVPSYQQSHTQRSSGYGRGGSYYQDLGYGGSSDVD
jgi:hypothetical protein